MAPEPMTYAERLQAARTYSDTELHHLAQCCADLTCVYHGVYNQVRHERGIR